MACNGRVASPFPHTIYPSGLPTIYRPDVANCPMSGSSAPAAFSVTNPSRCSFCLPMFELSELSSSWTGTGKRSLQDSQILGDYRGSFRFQTYAMDADKGTILWQSNAGQSTGGCIVTSRAGGRQLIGVASGMKSPMWRGGAQQSRILVYGLRAPLERLNESHVFQNASNKPGARPRIYMLRSRRVAG
jgi:hypothetical protein